MSKYFSYVMILSIVFSGSWNIYTSERDGDFVRPAPRPSQKVVQVLYNDLGRKLMSGVHDTGKRISCSRNDINMLLHGPVGASSALIRKLMPRKSIAVTKETPKKTSSRNVIDLTQGNSLQDRSNMVKAQQGRAYAFDVHTALKEFHVTHTHEKPIEHTNPVKHPGYLALQRFHQKSLENTPNKRRRIQEKIANYADPTSHPAYKVLHGKR